MDIGGLRLEMRGMVHHLGVLLESRERGEGGVVDVDVDVAPEQGGPRGVVWFPETQMV